MIAALVSRTAAAPALRTVTALVAVMTIVWPLAARAEGPTDYCRKVTARAEGDAALMFAPTVHAQLIRFPNGSPADTTGVVFGEGVQPRASMSVGFVDIYKGFGVLDVARADCRRQQSQATLEEVIAQRADIGRVPALERKLAFLRGQAAAVQEIVRTAEERFAAHTSTIAEVQDVRIRALTFGRRVADAERELAVIKARGLAMPVGSLSEALKTYEMRSIEHEGNVAHVRRLVPWKLNLTGGVAATPSAQVFGVAELSYNLGGLFTSEGRAVESRANELKNARYELRQQIETITRELRVTAAHARIQAREIEQELGRMSRDRASLEGTEAPNKHTVLATMTLQMIDLEAEQTFLTTLADNQAAFGGDK